MVFLKKKISQHFILSPIWKAGVGSAAKKLMWNPDVGDLRKARATQLHLEVFLDLLTRGVLDSFWSSRLKVGENLLQVVLDLELLWNYGHKYATHQVGERAQFYNLFNGAC